MAKIDIDTEIMSNELLPQSADLVKHINSALDTAQGITFPDGGLGWGNIVSNLQECSSISNKYNTWINKVTNSFNSNIEDNLEILSKFKVEDIIKRDSIVKGCINK